MLDMLNAPLRPEGHPPRPSEDDEGSRMHGHLAPNHRDGDVEKKGAGGDGVGAGVVSPQPKAANDTDALVGMADPASAATFQHAATAGATRYLPTQVALAPASHSASPHTISRAITPIAIVSGLRTVTAGVDVPKVEATFTLDSTGSPRPLVPSSAARPLNVSMVPEVAPNPIPRPSAAFSQTGILPAKPPASLITASASMSALAGSTPPNNNVAMDRANTSPPNSSNIFDRSNKLFPLAIVIIIIACIFLLVALTIVWLRCAGFTKKRKLRSLSSVDQGDEKGTWDPKVEPTPFHLPGEGRAPGIASTARASIRAIHTYIPTIPQRPARPLEWEIVNPPKGSEVLPAFIPYAPPTQSLAPPRVKQNRVLNPFHSPRDSLDVPQWVIDISAGGSPASFSKSRPALRDPFSDGSIAHTGAETGDAGYGYVVLDRSSSTSTSSSGSFYASRRSQSHSISSGDSDSLRSHYLATYSSPPSIPGVGTPRGEGAELKILKSAGARVARYGHETSGGSGRSGKLAKDGGWRMDL